MSDQLSQFDHIKDCLIDPKLPTAVAGVMITGFVLWAAARRYGSIAAARRFHDCQSVMAAFSVGCYDTHTLPKTSAVSG